MTYRVEAAVSDVSNLSVSQTKTFTALPGERLIGIKHDFVADKGKPFPIKVIVTDPQGKVIAGEKLKVELQQMKYSSVTQLQEGSETSRNQVEYKTVETKEVTSATEAKTISLTPPESGSYRIRVNFSNSKNDLSATDTQIWVTGDESIYWGDRETDNRLEIKLDKESYKPGEVATALIQSPYPEAELYFAVVRRGVLYSKTEKVTGGAPKIQFTVTPEMTPNAAVEAILIRQGKPLKEVEPGSIEKLVKIGFTPFKTSLADKYLEVKITPQEEKLEPGKTETLTLELKDSQKNPIEGQFTVMVVNEAILQLTGYSVPDLVETVYAAQDISTRLSDNRPQVVLQSIPSPLDKGWGFGGGYSKPGADTRVRKNFQPLAYYNGSVVSDARGQAKVTFSLPDDLTTWRVMVVATDGDFHFGKGDTSIITTKPLVTNPILPQFARLGDTFQGGVSVTNNTQDTGSLSIYGTVTGNLRFRSNSQLTESLQTKTTASGTRGYNFPLIASQVGEGTVKFVTKLNNQSDAFEVPFEVKGLEVSEQVIESGTTDYRVKIPIEVPQNVVTETGGLGISLGSTLVPDINASARQVFETNELPFLETSASQLLIASNLQLLNQTQGFNLPQKVTQSLDNLQKLQKPDGGFAYFPTAKTSDPFLTPYAAESLAKAKSAGWNGNPLMLNSLKIYLDKLLANPGQYDFCRTTPCQQQVRLNTLIALGELGDKRTDFLVSIAEDWQKLAPAAQIRLARYLSQFPEWKSQAQTITDTIEKTIYETGRSATINLPNNRRWMDSNTTTQAQALRLFIAQKAKPEVLDRLLQGLLALRRNGTWLNSYDNAQALTALVEYSQLNPVNSNFTATIKLGKKQLGSFKFTGDNRTNYNLKIPMKELTRGRNEVTLQKSGQGTLHYLTEYKYRLKGSQPGRLNGLRIIRYVRPANQQQILRQMNLYASDETFSLTSGQVYDIGLEIITDRPVNQVVINDPIPAGLEAVDTSFQTATKYYQAQQDSWEINYQQIHRDKVTAYADHFDSGVYSLHYLVRSVIPGFFEWSGAEVHLQYAPEEFGRTASSRLEIKE
jgi:uncharacterized protein YfaS (alpha-2-macroglobulin family)